MEAGNPHPTIYIQNLNEKVNLKHVKDQLQEWFSPFGKIVNIVLKKRLVCRGQAWIQYDSTESARKAIEGMQGKRLYGKTMVIKFAKFKSDSVSKADGTYEVEKYHRDQDKMERARNPRMTRRQIMNQLMANPALASISSSMAPGPAGIPMGVGSDLQIPNKILFLTALPPGVTEATLNQLFQRHAGFVEVRSVPNRPDLAFVEYENEAQAAVAKNALDRYEVAPGAQLRVSFARR